MNRMRWIPLGAGLVLLAVGAVGAVREWPIQGLTIIFVFGVVCLLLALIADRIQHIGVGHGETKVNFRLSPLMPVQELNQVGLDGAAATYAFIHNQLADDPATHEVKVRLQDRLVELVKQNSFTVPVDQERVRRALTQGSPAERVLAFGLLQSQPTLTTVEFLEQGILDPKSGNEQYHALCAAEPAWSRLTNDERERIKSAVRLAPFIADDPDRQEVADRLLGRDP